jgi:hypothetical protein
MAGESGAVIHECGKRLNVTFDEYCIPTFSFASLFLHLCPKCSRRLVDDWCDEQWRFWTPLAWQKVNGTWQKTINELEES